jgi:hypothetical protein
MVSIALGRFLITSKASDARRRGATTEAYEAIRRKEERALARLRREGNAADDALLVDQGVRNCVDRLMRL